MSGERNGGGFQGSHFRGSFQAQRKQGLLAHHRREGLSLCSKCPVVRFINIFSFRRLIFLMLEPIRSPGCVVVIYHHSSSGNRYFMELILSTMRDCLLWSVIGSFIVYFAIFTDFFLISQQDCHCEHKSEWSTIDNVWKEILLRKDSFIRYKNFRPCSPLSIESSRKMILNGGGTTECFRVVLLLSLKLMF